MKTVSIQSRIATPKRQRGAVLVISLVILLVIGFTIVLTMGDMLAPVLASIVIAYLLEGMVRLLMRLNLPLHCNGTSAPLKPVSRKLGWLWVICMPKASLVNPMPLRRLRFTGEQRKQMWRQLE